MFARAFKEARHAIDGVALEAAFSLAAVILACGACLLAAVGIAWWLAMHMPVYFALLITAGATALCAGLIYIIGHNLDAPKPEPEEPAEAAPALHALMTSLGSLSSLAPSLDVVATGLLARQFKRAPVSAVAAIVAVGAVMGALSAADETED